CTVRLLLALALAALLRRHLRGGLLGEAGPQDAAPAQLADRRRPVRGIDLALRQAGRAPALIREDRHGEDLPALPAVPDGSGSTPGSRPPPRPAPRRRARPCSARRPPAGAPPPRRAVPRPPPADPFLLHPARGPTGHVS